MAYKFTGVVNLKWIEATRLVGMQYKPSEIKLGWPMAMEPCRIACLQYPQRAGSYEYLTGQSYIHTALQSACESGDIPHIEYDRVEYWIKTNGELDAIDQRKEFAIEAKDFVEWLDARFEKPSEYIDAWFQANKMEVVQHTAPVAEPVPTTSTAQPLPPPIENRTQRQKRRYQMCVDAGITTPDGRLKQNLRGIGELAKRERISRWAFTEDVKKYVAETFTA